MGLTRISDHVYSLAASQKAASATSKPRRAKGKKLAASIKDKKDALEIATDLMIDKGYTADEAVDRVLGRGFYDVFSNSDIRWLQGKLKKVQEDIDAFEEGDYSARSQGVNGRSAGKPSSKYLFGSVDINPIKDKMLIDMVSWCLEVDAKYVKQCTRTRGYKTLKNEVTKALKKLDNDEDFEEELMDAGMGGEFNAAAQGTNGRHYRLSDWIRIGENLIIDHGLSVRKALETLVFKHHLKVNSSDYRKVKKHLVQMVDAFEEDHPDLRVSGEKD